MSNQTQPARPAGNMSGVSASLLTALNTAAMALQASAHSEEQVFRVVREQITAMGLRGGLSLLDATGANLVLRVIAQPDAILQTFKKIQTLLHLEIEGFTFPAHQVEAYRQVIESGTILLVANGHQTVLQLLPEVARPFATTILKVYGSSTAIFAPLITAQRVQGVLNIVSKSLTEDDLPAMQAFANHIAIALENARLFAAQHASEERFRALIEQANDLIAILSADGAIQYVSPSVERVLHHQPAELIGKNIFDLAHPDDLPTLTSALAHRVAHPGIAGEIMQARVRHKNGAWRWLEASGNNLLDNSTIGGIVLTCHDITERKRAQDALKRREAIFQAVSFAAGLFLKQATWEQNIQAVLARFGEATGISRVYIFENFTDPAGELCMRYRDEWCAPDIAPQVTNPELQAIPYASIAPRWADLMGRGDLVFGNIREFPPGKKEGLAAQDIQALVAVPIFVDGTWWGFIGFDDCLSERAWSDAELDALKTAADILGQAIQSQRAEDARRARERHLTLLNEITRAGISATDLQATLQVFSDRLGDLFDADGGYISFWDPVAQLPIHRAASGLLREIYPKETALSGPSMTGSVLTAGHALVAEDVFNSPYINPQTAARYPTRSLLGLPLIAGDQKFGAALIGFNRPHKFTPAEIARGEQAAGQIALAIAKIKSFEAEQARVTELQAVQRATLTLTARLDLQEVLDAILESALQLASTTKDAHIFLFANDQLTFGAARWMDGQRNKSWSAPRQNGLTYTVARSGQTLMIPDMSRHPIYASAPAEWHGGIIGQPLKIGARVVGVMNLAYAEPHTFSESEARALRLLADHAAIAIENARLFQAEKQRAAELEAVRQASISLTSSLDLPTVLNTILQNALELVQPANDMHIFLYDNDRLTFGAALLADGRKSSPWSTPREDGVTYQVARQGQPLIIPDTRVHPIYAGAAADWGGAIISLPLKIGARVVGVMNVAYWDPREFSDTEVRVLELHADQAAIAIENARLFAAEHAAREQAESLRQAAQAVSASLELDQVLRQILDQLKRMIASDTASVFLFTENGAPDLIAGTGYRDEISTSHVAKKLLEPSPILRRMSQDQQPIIIPDVREHPDWIWVPGAEHVRAFLATPILAQGRMIGVLMMDSQTVNAYHENDLRLAQTLAQHLAIAIENARLYEQTQQRALEFAALYDTARELAGQYDLQSLLKTIVERAAKLLGATGGSVHLYNSARGDLEIIMSTDPTTQIGTRLQLGEGMAGKVAQTREPLIVTDYASWEGRSTQFSNLPKITLAQAPMVYGGELIGVLSVRQVGDNKRSFTQADAELLTLFASQAASVLQNARLYNETNLRADQLTRLYDAGLTLNRVLDPREQLEFLLKTAMQALHGDYAQFFRWDATTNSLQYEWGIGHTPETKDTLRQIAFPCEGQHSIADWVTQYHIPLYLPDVSMDPRYTLVDPDIRAGLWVPIDHEEERRGVLAVLSKQLNAFTPQDERLLTLFANQVAVAMENARLFEATQHHLAELQAVNRISIALRAAHTLEEMLPLLVNETAQIIGNARVSVWLHDRETNNLCQAAHSGFQTINLPLKPGEGIAGHVFISGEPHISPEFKTDPLIDERARANEPSGLGGVCVPIRTVEETIGVLFVSVASPREISASEIHLTTTIAEIAGNAIHRMRLNQQTQHLLSNLTFAYDETIEGWARALDLRDKETQGHTRRVVELTLLLARALGIPDHELQSVRWGALLHDIGKMGIPDAILLKPSPLSETEWEIMRLHPAYAHRLLAPVEYLRGALEIPYCHHEKWDGTGYPRGLAGEAIPLAARLFAVVDVWDALRSNRPYRAAWPRERALEYIREQSGQHFDPKIVNAFLEMENGHQ